MSTQKLLYSLILPLALWVNLYIVGLEMLPDASNLFRSFNKRRVELKENPLRMQGTFQQSQRVLLSKLSTAGRAKP
ncbi:Cip1-Interacting Zinc Finger Protein [Manis pentadactyla]|nr:Cip1-Interacting Zinc Finger Protein [Manis pentadactyla]